MPQTLTTTAERIGKDRVKLRIEVGEDALRPAIDAAYKRWSQQIRVPGFRKGKVPRALIDSHVGPGAVRAEAIEDALPGLLRDALKENDLEAIAPAEIDNLEGVDGEGPLVFEATVDVRPEIALPDLSSIEVEAPPSEITDEDIDEQLERLRDRFAELESVVSRGSLRRLRPHRPQGIPARRARRRRQRPRLPVRGRFSAPAPRSSMPSSRAPRPARSSSSPTRCTSTATTSPSTITPLRKRSPSPSWSKR